MSNNKKRKQRFPSKIFVDADAFVAIANKEDPNHKIAVRIAKLLDEHRASLITSGFAFGEAVTVISQKVGLNEAVQAGLDISQGVAVIDTSSEHRERALQRFAMQTTKNARFTDVVNMVLMDELKTDTIFSFDEHYKKSGYKLLA